MITNKTTRQRTKHIEKERIESGTKGTKQGRTKQNEKDGERERETKRKQTRTNQKKPITREN